MASVLDALGSFLSVPASGVALVREGLSSFGGRTGFAAAIAGTSNPSSKEYKAALKSVERWDRYAGGERGKDVRNPDRMRDTTRQKISEALRGARLGDGVELRVRGDVTVSKDRRHRNFSVELSPAEVRGMLAQARQAEALGDDPVQAAMNVVTGAYLGSDAPYANQALPYSERMQYHSVSVVVLPSGVSAASRGAGR